VAELLQVGELLKRSGLYANVAVLQLIFDVLDRLGD